MVTVKSMLRSVARKRSYSFEKLWPKLTAIIAKNIRKLPVEFGPRELFQRGRKLGYIRETRTGRLIVQIKK